MKLSVHDIQQCDLRAGQSVWLSGTLITARDAAHRRLFTCLEQNTPLPVDLRGAVVYYAGPTPAPPGHVIGSVGPTTAGRMDVYTPRLLEAGVAAMVGKGGRRRPVVEAMKRCGATYFCAIGGAGALIADCVKAVEILAFPELGCEAMRALTVVDLPLVVGIDRYGVALGELIMEAE